MSAHNNTELEGLKLHLLAMHSKKRQVLINNDSLPQIKTVLQEIEKLQSPRDDKDEKAIAEMQERLNKFRQPATLLFHDLLDPIIDKLLEKLRHEPDDFKASLFVQEHAEEFTSLYLSAPEAVNPDEPLAAQKMKLYVLLAFAQLDHNGNEVEYIKPYRKHKELIDSLKIVHPIYAHTFGITSPAVNFVPAHMLADIPSLVNDLENTHPLDMHEFLRTSAVAGRIISGIVRCDETAGMRWQTIDKLAEIAQEHGFHNVEYGLDKKAEKFRTALENGEHPFIPTKQFQEEYLDNNLPNMEASLASLGVDTFSDGQSFKGKTGLEFPVAIKISADSLIENGEQIFSYFPTITHLQINEITPHNSAQLADCAALRFARTIDIQNCPEASAHEIAQFAANPNLKRISAFGVADDIMQRGKLDEKEAASLLISLNRFDSIDIESLKHSLASSQKSKPGQETER